MGHLRARRTSATVATVVALLLVGVAALAVGAGAGTGPRMHRADATAARSTSAVADQAAAPLSPPDPFDRPVATAVAHPRTALAARALGPLLFLLVAGLLGWLTTTRRWRPVDASNGATPRSWIACSLAPRAPPVSSHP